MNFRFSENKTMLVFWPLVLVSLLLASQYSFLLFHVSVELFSVVVGFSVFLFAWNTRKYADYDFLAFLGIVYLFVSGIDAIHTFAYKGMGVFSFDEINPSVQLWIAARYLESASLFASVFLIEKKIKFWPTLWLYAGLFTLILLSIFWWEIFPVCWVDESGLTPFKIYSEYIISLILLLTIVLLIVKKYHQKRQYQILILALACSIVSEIFFTFYVSVYGLSNLMGHFFKLFSFYLIYRILIEYNIDRPISNLFKELGKREEQYRRVVQTSPDSIFLLGLDLNINMANPQAAELLRVNNIDELIGQNILDFVALEDHPKAEENTQALLKGEFLKDVLYRSQTKQGEPFLAEASSSMVQNDQGEAIGFMIVVRDVTKRKQLEEDLILAKEQAENANDLKDKFVSLVSHDLRGPLGGSLSLLRQLKDGSYQAKDQNEAIDTLVQTHEEMLQMINSLLNIGKIKSGGLTLHKSFIRLSNLADEVLASFREAATRKKIHLANLVEKNSIVYADQDLLREVLKNLVSNAVKFCHADKRIEISFAKNSPRQILVSDTGIGIDDSLLPNLFRYDVKTTKKGTAGEKGTGLGLPLCRDIAEFHGGSLRVETKVGEGSRFYFSLPDAIPTLLIVDDTAMFREEIKFYLKDEEYQIIEAENGQQALDLLRREKIDLVITDVFMPVLDGYGLVQELKNQLEFKSIPIMAVSSDEDPQTQIKMKELGVDVFLKKPLVKSGFKKEFEHLFIL